MMISQWQKVRVWPQYLIPKHLMTHVAWWLSNIRWAPFKNTFIRLFCSLFPVDLSEAVSDDVEAYEHFNAFFTRPLKPGSRPLAEATLVSPADGVISQLGNLTGDEKNQLIQAKGLDYSLADLVASSLDVTPYIGGQWMTIYLAPFDYHRVHVPAEATLQRAIRIPGELFSVSDKTALAIPKLYARNERLVCEFQHVHGPFLVVMVAALMVAGIETVWEGADQRRVFDQPTQFSGAHPTLAQGEEMGRFHWGSTVIVVTPSSFPQWRETLGPGQTIRLNQALTAD